MKIKEYFKKVNPLKFKSDEKISKIVKLGRGESNLNFLIQTTKNRYMMRLDIINNLVRFKQEYEILTKLESLDIAPKPLFIDTTKKHFNDSFMILSYIEGETLDKLNKKIYLPHYIKLAEKLANLHKLNLNLVNKTSSFEERLIRTERIITGLKKDLEEFSEKDTLLEMFEIYHENLKRGLKEYKPILTFCHGDVCLPNVLFDKKEFFLLDWELAGNLDPALEISYHFYEFPYTLEEKDGFLKRYLAIREDKTLIKRMQFTNFFVAFSGYFDILHTCFNIAKKRGHKDYLKSADFEEYWKWGNHYLTFVCKLNLFDRRFEKVLKKNLKTIYKIIRMELRERERKK